MTIIPTFQYRRTLWVRKIPRLRCFGYGLRAKPTRDDNSYVYSAEMHTPWGEVTEALFCSSPVIYSMSLARSRVIIEWQR